MSSLLSPKGIEYGRRNGNEMRGRHFSLGEHCEERRRGIVEGERWIRMDGGTVNLLSLDCTNYGS